MAAAPAKKKTNPLLYVGIGCGLLFLLSCVGGNLYWFLFAPDADDVAEAVEDANEAANEASGEAAGGGDTGGGGGGVCGRAAECCEAYVDEMGAAAASVRSTCANYNQMAGGPAEAGCQSAIDGWRSGLQAMGRDVPTPCQ